jgi:hypothetical protein
MAAQKLQTFSERENSKFFAFIALKGIKILAAIVCRLANRF